MKNVRKKKNARIWRVYCEESVCERKTKREQEEREGAK